MREKLATVFEPKSRAVVECVSCLHRRVQRSYACPWLFWFRPIILQSMFRIGLENCEIGPLCLLY